MFFKPGSEIARIGDSKLASYLKKPLLDKLLEIVASISRSPSSSSRSKLVEPDPELVSSMKGALKGLCGDRHSRPILIDLELLSTFNNIIKSKGVATCWRIHVMDCMKSFFGSGTAWTCSGLCHVRFFLTVGFVTSPISARFDGVWGIRIST
jgi:hypothetical protein